MSERAPRPLPLATPRRGLAAFINETASLIARGGVGASLSLLAALPLAAVVAWCGSLSLAGLWSEMLGDGRSTTLARLGFAVVAASAIALCGALVVSGPLAAFTLSASGGHASPRETLTRAMRGGARLLVLYELQLVAIGVAWLVAIETLSFDPYEDAGVAAQMALAFVLFLVLPPLLIWWPLAPVILFGEERGLIASIKRSHALVNEVSLGIGCVPFAIVAVVALIAGPSRLGRVVLARLDVRLADSIEGASYALALAVAFVLWQAMRTAIWSLATRARSPNAQT